MGVLWFGVYLIALNAAEQHIDAGTASMLIQLSPIVISVLASVFLHERPNSYLAIGLLVALAGVVLIAIANTVSAGGTSDLLDVLFVLAAAVACAVGVIAQKSVLFSVPALEVTFFFLPVMSMSRARTPVVGSSAS